MDLAVWAVLGTSMKHTLDLYDHSTNTTFEQDVVSEDHDKLCLVHDNQAPYSDFFKMDKFILPQKRPEQQE